MSFQLNIAEGNCLALEELYENLVFIHLTKNKCFKVRHFDRRSQPDSHQITFSNICYYSNRDYFCCCSESDHQHQQPTVDTLYRPKEVNKRGIDAVLIVSFNEGWMIQITMNSKHSRLDVTNVPNRISTYTSTIDLIDLLRWAWLTCGES